MSNDFDRLDARTVPATAPRTWEKVADHEDTRRRKQTLTARREQTSIQSHARGALRYHASEELQVAINTALALEMPLLIAGRPGTGKTQVAWFVAAMFGLEPPYRVTVRSDSTRRDLLYDFDAVGDFRDANERGRTETSRKLDRTRHVQPRALWKGIVADEPCVVLIDEIDKAPRDLPNDLLSVLNDFEFEVPELDYCLPSEVRERFGRHLVQQERGSWWVRGDPDKRRPIVVITTNSERQLPEPFLRRCVFHFIELDAALVKGAYKCREDDPELRVLKDHPPVVDLATDKFMALAKDENLRKPPSISEFLSWLQLLAQRPDTHAALNNPVGKLPFLSVLLKTQDDLEQVGALAPQT